MTQHAKVRMGAMRFAFVGLAFFAGSACGQSIKELAGSYTIVSVTVVQGDKKIEPFGPNPRGAMILDSNGRYVVSLMRPDLPKFASNNRNAGTPEENRAIVTGSFTHFGTYSVADGYIIFRLEKSTYPNWDGDEQKRALTIAGDQLSYTLTSTIGGTSTVVWKRAK
jgi:hypothetical protein